MGIFKYVFLVLLIENSIDSAFGNKVTKAFKSYEIVPDYVLKAPECEIEVVYSCNVKVDFGNELTPSGTRDIPEVTYEAKEQKYYALFLIDHDVHSRENSSLAEFAHWIVVNIPGNKIDNGETLAEYFSPAPPKGTGLHRYVFLVYEQPDKLDFDEEKKLDNKSEDGRYYFDVCEFADKYDLGDPIAGNFFTAKYDRYVDTINKRVGDK